MSLIVSEAEMLAAGGVLVSPGSAVTAANGAAAISSAGLVPATADEVSALTAAQFQAHAAMYQAVSAEAAAVHDMFVTTLTTSSGSYVATETNNVGLTS
jgi:hypothetical protein